MEYYITWGLLAAAILLLLILLFRRPKKDGAEERLREEIRAARRETGAAIASDARHRAEEDAARQERLYRTLTEQTTRQNAALTEAVGRLQQSNEQKLEQMRQTVDEKLTATLQTRLDASFQAVGEQLQNVYKSLGEMRTLASGVSDLQRVLTNVKARGTWAEVQLGELLGEILTPDQFDRNVSPRHNTERVEYAVKIPSRQEEGKFVWLPIDSKFPQEDYLRLCEAADRADPAGVEAAAKALEQVVKKQAADISRLYLNLPVTTDFAIMFLPTEGLYAEVLRRPGLAEEIQRKNRVMICGPTTLTAFLNTLRMGFRTIALDRRAAEVWQVLGAAKAQYEKFEIILDKVHRKIEEAGSTLEDARRRNEVIRKNLKGVEQLPAGEAAALLDLPEEE